jgi:hypothetical protein
VRTWAPRTQSKLTSSLEGWYRISLSRQGLLSRFCGSEVLLTIFDIGEGADWKEKGVVLNRLNCYGKVLCCVPMVGPFPFWELLFYR